MGKVKFAHQQSAILFVSLLVLLLFCNGCNASEQESSVLVLSGNSSVLEYGTPISLRPEDYLDASAVDAEVLAATQVSTNAENERILTTNEAGEEITEENPYPPVGEYIVTLRYKNDTVSVSVQVVDTTAPEFDGLLETYTLIEGAELDLSGFTATDLSGVTMAVQDESVDYDTAGVYQAVVQATDAYGNRSEAEITVEIIAEEPPPAADSSLSVDPVEEENGQAEASEENSQRVKEDETNEDPSDNSSAVSFADTDETVYVVNTSSLRVRSGPGTDYSAVGSLSSGAAVKRTGISNSGWSRIEYDGAVAYAASQYLSTTAPSSSSSGSDETEMSGSAGSSGGSTASGDVSSLRVASETNKIIIVSVKSVSSSSGTFTYYEKKNGAWETVISTTATLGKNGIGKTKEGDKKTPTGLFHFTMLMGIASDPGTIMSYTQITSTMYWCGGETYYNQLVDESTSSHDCDKSNDEHLIDYATAYKYLAVIDYNSSNVYQKGSAIFLHCKTGSSYTLGCIAISESYMKQMMAYIDSGTVIIIDTESNINSSNY